MGTPTLEAQGTTTVDKVMYCKATQRTIKSVPTYVEQVYYYKYFTTNEIGRCMYRLLHCNRYLSCFRDLRSVTYIITKGEVRGIYR